MICTCRLTQRYIPVTNEVVKFTIKGNPITKKNSQSIYWNSKTNRPFITQKPAYKNYEEMALWQLPKVYFNCPVNVKCVYYMQKRQKVDLTNLLEATDDILVKGGVLADDNCTILVSHDGSCVLYDKENPRVEIEIKEREWQIWQGKEQ